MSDEAAKSFETSSKEDGVKPEGRSVTLSITLHPNGQIEFSLPTNKVLAHGLLGVAQEQLTKLAMVAEAQQATSSRGGMNGLLKRMQGG